MRLSSSRQAFTLVELVLALGVATVAIFGLIGAVNVALRAEGQARDDTALAALSSRMVAQLSSATNLTTLQGLASTNYYFDATGAPVVTASAYAATVTLSQTNLLSFPSGKGVALAQIQITWPPGVHPANTNLINATLPLSY